MSEIDGLRSQNSKLADELLTTKAQNKGIRIAGKQSSVDCSSSHIKSGRQSAITESHQLLREAD
jgi:hypothetical protein